MISQIITRDHLVFHVDESLFVEAISRVFIKQQIEHINNEIAALLSFVEEVPPTEFDSVQILQELAELRNKRQKAGKLLKLKSHLVSALLHKLWIDRIQSTSRNTARIVYDSLSITMPIPPTNETVLCSFICGRIVNGTAC